MPEDALETQPGDDQGPVQLAGARSGRAAVIAGALRNGQLRRVLAAFFVFNVAEWAAWIALLVWAYDWAGVNGASAVAVAQLVPAAALASVAAGRLARRSRTSALVRGYVAQAATYLVLGVTLALDAPVPVVVLAAVCSAVTVTLTRPVHNSLLPEISRTTGDLTVGNSASGTLEATAIVIGPLVSGLVIALWGPAGVVLVAAAATGLAVVATTGLVTGAGAPVSSVPIPAPTPPRLHEVLRDPAARVLSAMVAAESVLVGMIDILVVFLALDLLDMSQSGPGVLSSGLGIGGLVGAALTFLLVGRQRLGLALVAGGLGAGLPFAAAGYSPGVAAAAVLLLACGAGKAFFEVTARTFLQRLLPDRLLTAVFGLQESILMAGLATGALAAPILVELAGARGAFVVAGLFLPLVTIASWSQVRRLDAEIAVPVDVLTLLLDVPILSVLAPRIVERMAREAVAVSASDGATLISEGEPGDRFYVIAEGEVLVTRAGQPLRRLGPGAWFGELALLRDAPRSASVVAVGSVSLWAVDRDAFLAAVGGSRQSVRWVDEHARDHYR
jgi:predicted MFS family arabinose efflux permease